MAKKVPARAKARARPAKLSPADPAVYDSLGQLASDRVAISGSAAQVVGLGWDAAGNLTQVQYPGGRVINQAYDALNRKQSITEGSSTLASYTYIGPFALTETKQLGNGTSAGYSYDVHERVSQIVHRVGSPFSGTPITGTSLEWDAANNKTARTNTVTGVRHDYSYDSLGRLAQSVRSGSASNRTIVYTLDGVGNRISATGGPGPSVYVMDATTPAPADRQMNQYTQSTVDPETDEGAKQQAYDNDGNVKSLGPIFPNAGTTKLVWYDYRNHMVQVQISNVQPKHKYIYDAFGRLVSIIKNASTTPVETRLYYAKFHVIEEQTTSGSTLATYVWGQNIDEPVEMTRGTSVYYYQTDDLNNVMCLTSASASVVESYEYSDYGRILSPSTWQPLDLTTSVNVYFWQGSRYEALSKWYYDRSRFLMPGKGRFTTRDEIGIWGDAGNLGNAYTFAGNNPWSRTDPTGHGWLGAIAGCVIGAAEGALSALYHGGDTAAVIGGALKGGIAGAVIGSAAEGAIEGGVVGTIGGAAAGCIKAAVSGGNILEGTEHGAVVGGEIGAIIGANVSSGGLASTVIAGGALNATDSMIRDAKNGDSVSGATIRDFVVGAAFTYTGEIWGDAAKAAGEGTGEQAAVDAANDVEQDGFSGDSSKDASQGLHTDASSGDGYGGTNTSA